jgi:hypothetical protein
MNYENEIKQSKVLVIQEDKCKLHLAEIYTLTKKNERLASNIETFEQCVEDLKIKVKNSEEQFLTQIHKLNCENENLKKANTQLIEKNKLLQNTTDHHELIDYYEKKLEESYQKVCETYKDFSSMINKFPSNGRDEVWRNLIKKYEDKIVDYEKEISDLNKKERKMNYRQKFFEKYCYRAEERIENLAKLTKKFHAQENILNKFQIEKEKLLKENDYKEQKINILKIETKNMKNFLDKISPIIKLDWKDVKISNDKSYQIYNKNSKDEKIHDRSIIVLIENLLSYFSLFEITRGIGESKEIIQIISDIKEYVIMLLKKIDILSINHFNIINSCCDLNDKVQEIFQKNKSNKNSCSILNDIKNSCAKLLFEFNPNNN